MFITLLLFGNEVISLDFHVFRYAYSINQFKKQNVKYDIKSKYPKEYSTVDKVGREKLLVKKSCYRF